MGIQSDSLGGEIRADEARFRTIYENAPFMINSFNREGRVVLWNRACTGLLGYSREEMETADDPLSLFYPDLAIRNQVLAEIVRADGLFREYKVRRRDGHFVYQMWANFLLPDESLISVGYDVSALRDARENLRIANQDLEQKIQDRTRELDQERARLFYASKFAALGEMAGGIAHEINNPLAVISGLAEQLQNLHGDDSGKLRQQMLANIRSSVSRISKIVSGLRKFSRDASRDPMTHCPADTIVQDILGYCGERFRNGGVSLEMIPQGSVGTLECRPVEIGQILLNLLNNAYDAVSGTSGAWVRVLLRESQADFYFEVVDSGAGITDEVRTKIFQPFFTTKPIGQGTGIGLSISLGIAEAHGGSLRYELRDGHTCFVLQLPKLQVREPTDRQEGFV